VNSPNASNSIVVAGDLPPHSQCRECLFISQTHYNQCPSCATFLSMGPADTMMLRAFLERKRQAQLIRRDEQGNIVSDDEPDMRPRFGASNDDDEEEDDEDEEDLDDDEESEEDDEEEEAPTRVAKVKRAGDVKAGDLKRISTGDEGFDKVLGGGLPEHNSLMLAASPGTGKTTLLLQCGAAMAERKLVVMFASGEQGIKTLKRNMKRLKLYEKYKRGAVELLMVHDDEPESILAAAHANDVDVLLLDSIPMMRSKSVQGPPGASRQMNHCAELLMKAAHSSGPFKRKKSITIVAIAHATKGNDMAGSNTAKHLLDGAFYMEHIHPVTFEVTENQNIQTGFVRLRVHGKYREGEGVVIAYYRMTKEGLVEFDPEDMKESRDREDDDGPVKSPVFDTYDQITGAADAAKRGAAKRGSRTKRSATGARKRRSPRS